MRTATIAGLMLWLCAGRALAADACPTLRTQLFAPDVATRVAAAACNENLLWYRPFIDTNGRMASATVAEGESSRLGDGASEAWRRVAVYWRESGLLPQMGGYAGAGECGYASGDRSNSPGCRAFVIDHPWSAAFVSWVMEKAGVPGFRPSASHFDYVREARVHPESSPFLYLDPATTRPAPGDLLCYVRVPGRAYGYAGLAAAIDGGADALNMHCDVVVAASPGNDGKAWMIGGNVQQGVTMRLLNLNRNGLLWSLPRRIDADPPCSPDLPQACNFNRQDWAVLLKLRPAADLARLGPVQRPVAGPIVPQPSQQFCVYCVVGAQPPVPRCPARAAQGAPTD